MIHEQELEDAIAQMRGDPNPNANTCMKLAAYYVIRDHMEPGVQAETVNPPVPAGYTYAAGRESEPLPLMGDSEFYHAIQGLDAKSVLPLFNELLEAVSVFQPRMYENTIRKLKELPGA